MVRPVDPLLVITNADAGTADDQALETALSDAARQGLRGRGVTPFLLERLRALRGGGRASAQISPC